MKDNRVSVEVVAKYVVEDLDNKDLQELKCTLYTALITQRNELLNRDYKTLLDKLLDIEKELQYRVIV